MATAVFEHVAEQVGGAIQHVRVAAITRRAVDQAFDAHNLANFFEIAGRGLQLGDPVQAGEAGGLIALFIADFRAQAAGKVEDAIASGGLPRRHDEIARAHPGLVIGDAGPRLGKCQAELCKVFQGCHNHLRAHAVLSRHDRGCSAQMEPAPAFTTWRSGQYFQSRMNSTATVKPAVRCRLHGRVI